jgi:hypothetical protein
MMMLADVRAKVLAHKAFQMLKMSAFQTFEVKMVVTGMLRTDILIYAAALVLVRESSHAPHAAQLGQISVY